LAFSTQVVQDDLPAGAFDELLDAVVSDRGVVRCAARRT
jgi:5-formyltetrahydrofolate cyclo-ligase